MISYDRLQRIDELTRRDHYYLDADDECYFLGEYTARKGYQYSDTNNAIITLKTPPSLPENRQYHKRRAIAAYSNELRRLVGRNGSEGWTFVPVPSSKIVGHPDYDARLTLVLGRAFEGFTVDIRNLVKQRENRVAAHKDDSKKRSPDNFEYEIDESLTEPIPHRITIFDDMVTTGASYVAVKRILQRRFAGATIRGLFLSRCVHEADFGFFR